LRDAVRENASYHAAPPALRARLVARVTAPEPRSERPLDGTRAARRLWTLRGVVASLGVVAALMIALTPAWLHSNRDAKLTEEVVASHVRASLGQHLVDVASSDHHVVKPWLSARLDFSPPVRELDLAGSSFLGGRIDYLDGRPAAALVYRQGEHIVSAFIWPDTAADSTTAYSAVRGFELAHWTRGGMTHWVVSDLNRQEFSAVVRSLEAVGGG
jgi:anti-sigma factor RsiW